jgi:Spy/CpxP family protein refolding chaperone
MSNPKLLQRLVVTASLLAMCGISANLQAQESTPGTGQGTVQGQNQANATEPGQRHENELAKLNLSDDQKAQVKKIHEDTKAQMSAVQGDATLTADQKQAKMKQLRQASHKQVKQILTPEQRKQMKADESARRAARQQNGQTAPPQQ